MAFTTILTVKAEDATVNVKPSLGQIRADIKTKAELNSQNRNNMLQKKEVRQDAKAEVKDIGMIRASTTDMFRKGAETRKEIAKKMDVETFEVRKNALVKQLTISLNNLQNIARRIESRIIKAESANRNMTDAKALLIIANDKLAKARIEVAAFQAVSAPTANTSATASTTAEVDLVKPRQLGDAAIKSVKEAREAFKRVVTTIAHAMGLGNTASTTIKTEAEANESASTSN